MRKAAFIYSDEIARRDSRVDEIFGPTRLQYTYELLHSYGAFDIADSVLAAPPDADEVDLISFHSEEYVAAVKSLSKGETTFNPRRFNLGEPGDNPIYPGMYELSTLVVGASLCAADLVSSSKFDVAFNSAGGLHHAAPNHASGFCIFNDIVIALKHLLNKGFRVAYIDIDAHHGDGVQNAFFDNDQVLTISLHESGKYLFPGTGDVKDIGIEKGEGYSVNIPFAPFTDGEVYLWAFDQIVPGLVERFQPDILVTQLGCDSHYLDPLTQLNLTTDDYTELVSRMRNLAPRWVALGGGGYEVSSVIRLWTLAYGVMMDQEWSDEIPQLYQELYGIRWLRDKGEPQLDSLKKEQAYRFAQESVDGVKRLIFPHHRL